MCVVYFFITGHALANKHKLTVCVIELSERCHWFSANRRYFYSYVQFVAWCTFAALFIYAVSTFTVRRHVASIQPINLVKHVHCETSCRIHTGIQPITYGLKMKDAH